jgi:CubicO group peptidase (beta-lactamase class C family)
MRVGSDARMPPDVTVSGGGGLVASAADYLRFAQRLLNEGEYGSVRLLAPHAVRLMTLNVLPPDARYTDVSRRVGDTGPAPGMGQGFGLGFAYGSRRGSACPALEAAFAMNASTSTCSGACQWHGGSLKHGGSITMSAAHTSLGGLAPNEFAARS